MSPVGSADMAEWCVHTNRGREREDDTGRSTKPVSGCSPDACKVEADNSNEGERCLGRSGICSSGGGKITPQSCCSSTWSGRDVAGECSEPMRNRDGGGSADITPASRAWLGVLAGSDSKHGGKVASSQYARPTTASRPFVAANESSDVFKSVDGRLEGTESCVRDSCDRGCLRGSAA